MKFAKSTNPENHRTYVAMTSGRRIAVIDSDLPLKAVKALFSVDLDRIEKEFSGKQNSVKLRQEAIVASIPNARAI